MPNAILMPSGMVDAPDRRRRTLTPQDYELIQAYLRANSPHYAPAQNAAYVPVVETGRDSDRSRVTLSDLIGKKKKRIYVTSSL